MCRCLKIHRSLIYYKKVEKNKDNIIEQEIMIIFETSRNNYGARKIKVELAKLGHTVSKKRIRKYMVLNGLISNYTVKQFKVYKTKCNEEKVENKLNREFVCERELDVVVSDLTYVNVDGKWNITELEKYGLWDKLDDLQSLYKENAPEFDFVYYNNLNYLLERYMKLNKFTYTPKTILGQLTSEIVRNKYLLKELNDETTSIIIQNCITNNNKIVRLENYELLTRIVYKMTGGFEIDGFKFKSKKDA